MRLPLAMIILAVTALPLMAGCESGNLRHGVYESFRVQNNLQSTPSERAGKPELPDYGNYQRLKNDRLTE